MKNRGKHPNDPKLFNSKWHPIFQEAVNDLCYLLSKAYGAKSALEIVGNRYKLNKRQRLAILRMSSSEQEIATRKQRECPVRQIREKAVAIDGFNLLILLEGMLSEAYIFKCRDGTYRDISGIHGSYKRVVQTEEAIILIGNTLKNLRVGAIHWFLDSPISNSGRLKEHLLQISYKQNFSWEVELMYNPDKALIASDKIAITSDGWVLNEVRAWFNLPAYLVNKKLIRGNIIEA